MTPAAERLHRLLLVLLGALLLVGGVTTLLLGLGTFGDQVRHRPLFANTTGHYVGHNGVWLWPVAGLAGLALAYAAVRWLLTLLSTTRVGQVELSRAGDAGSTQLDSAALASAVSSQIRGYRGVAGAAAQVHGDARAPLVAVTVSVHSDTDLPALRRQIEREALADLRRAMEREDLPVRLDIAVNQKRAGRLG